MKQIHKDYRHPFLLEPTKLIRLVELIHDRLSEHQQTSTSDHFEVSLLGNRREELNKLDDVLALENPRKHRIQRLTIISSAAMEGAVRPEHDVQVEFGADRSDNRGKIAVSVRSENGGWANRTLSEIEEQIERTRLNYTVSILMLFCVLIVIGLVALQFVPFGIRLDRAETMWLRGDDLDRVEKILSQEGKLTDDEMRTIMGMQLKNVLEDQKNRHTPGKLRSGHWIFFLALVIVIGCVITLMASCYPAAIFLWGDEIQRYADILQRRRLIWGIIMSVMLVGVLSKSVYEGVVSLFP